MSFLEIMAQGFVLRALAAAALLGIAGGLLSFFVVQRRLAFMGHGVAHSMVAGVGLGVLFNWPVFWPALTVAVLVSVGVGWITRRGQVAEDSAIGITLSAALALGLILVSLKHGYAAALDSYLFGSLIAVLAVDLLFIGGLTLLIAALTARYWRALLLFAFDPEGAAVAGYPVETIRYGLLLLLALLIAVAMKIVGILLVGAILIIPAAAAGFWSARAGRVLWLSVAFALTAAVGGIALSVWTNAPSGAAIVVALVGLFVVGRIAGPYRR